MKRFTSINTRNWLSIMTAMFMSLAFFGSSASAVGSDDYGLPFDGDSVFTVSCNTLTVHEPTFDGDVVDWQYWLNDDFFTGTKPYKYPGWEGTVNEPYQLEPGDYRLQLDLFDSTGFHETVDTDYFTITGCDEAPVPPGLEVLRWYGADRYETAASLAANGQWGAGGTVYVATGQTAVDALVVSGASSGFGAMAVTPAAPGPILLTKQNQLPQATRGALTELAPSNIVLVGGESAASAAVEQALSLYAPTTRVAGADRYETAALIALQNDRDVVYLVSGDEAAFPDALSVAPLSRWQGGAVLLAKQNSLPPATRAALEALQPGRVVLVGGSDRVSDSVAQAAAEAAGLSSFERLAGDDRYATSQRVAGEFPNDVSTPAVYFATGLKFPDALGAGALAGSQAAPVLLVQPDSIPTGTIRAVEHRMPEHQIVVVGGPDTVSNGVLGQLRDLFGN